MRFRCNRCPVNVVESVIEVQGQDKNPPKKLDGLDFRLRNYASSFFLVAETRHHRR